MEDCGLACEAASSGPLQTFVTNFIDELVRTMMIFPHQNFSKQDKNL